MSADISNAELDRIKRNVKNLEVLCADNILEWRIPVIKQLIREVIEAVTFMQHSSECYSINRITINRNILKGNKRINRIEQLSYCPSDLMTAHGRCNLPKESVLYGSFIHLISFIELKPEFGDLITTTTWKSKNPSNKLLSIPFFLNQPVKTFIHPETGETHKISNINSFELEENYKTIIKDLPPNKMEANFLVLKFITNEFSKVVDRNYSNNYIVSAFISHLLFNEFEKPVDAVIYPSVQDGLASENIAVRADSFDKLYELEKVQESVVANVPALGGGFFSQVIGEAVQINHLTGEITWKDIDPSDLRLAQLQKQFNLDLS